MLVMPAAIGAFLLVNLLCACLALGVGFAAGAWFIGSRVPRPVADDAAKKQAARQAQEAKRATERAAMAASRVADLAQAVASDVGDHAAKMQAITNDLAGIERGSEAADAAVFSALDQMLKANTELQQRLDVAEKQLAIQAAEIKVHESEARTDSLTGLANRRAFDDELRRRLAEWTRKGTPCTLLLLDIDHFKRFNDTHGHQVGDEVLRHVAKVLTAQCRDMDLPCRYGGEEFGVILPATDPLKACKVAERIRVAIEESTTVCEGKKLKVTASLGLAGAMSEDDSPRLIRRADEGLYASKNAGRNCGHWNTGAKHVPITEPNPAMAPPPAAEVDEAEEKAAVAQSAKPVEPLANANGATFVQMLKRRVTESHRFGIPISIMYVKIEDYEVIRKKYGILVARQVVDAAGPAFQRVLREMDTMSRLENGEFIIMLPGSTQSDVLHVIKRMRSAAANCVLPMVDRQLELRFRHGVAELKANESAQDLLARARELANTPVPIQPAQA